MNEDKTGENQPKAEPSLVKSVVPIIFFTALNSILHDSGVPRPLAIMLSATVVFLPAYWFPPRPAISFLRYAIALELFLGEFVIGFWPIPTLLRHFMPIQFAYSIPALVVSVLVYFQLEFLHPKKNGSFGKWVFGSLVFALVVAGAVTILPQGK